HGQQRPWQRRGRVPVAGRQLAAQADRDSVGDQVQTVDLLVVESPFAQGADVQDAQQLTFREQWDTDESPQSLPPQQRVHDGLGVDVLDGVRFQLDRKSTRLNSSHVKISYAVFCLKKKKCKSSLLIPVLLRCIS